MLDAEALLFRPTRALNEKFLMEYRFCTPGDCASDVKTIWLSDEDRAGKNSPPLGRPVLVVIWIRFAAVDRRGPQVEPGADAVGGVMVQAAQQVPVGRKDDKRLILRPDRGQVGGRELVQKDRRIGGVIVDHRRI